MNPKNRQHHPNQKKKKNQKLALQANCAGGWGYSLRPKIAGESKPERGVASLRTTASYDDSSRD